MKKSVSGILFVLLLVGAFAGAFNAQTAKSNANSFGATAQPADPDWWPMIHHDLNHTGTSTSTGPTTNSTLWSYTTGYWVESCPAVVGGLVYVGSWDGNVYCLDAATGSLVWNYTTGGGVVSSPAIVGGLVYVGSGDNRTYCLNATDGTQVWNYTAGGEVRSSPSVVGGLVYVGSLDNNVYCLDAATGTLVWNYTTGGNVYSSPAVAGGFVYIGSYDGLVYCLNAATGTQVWNYTTGSLVDSSPSVVGGLVYVGSGDNSVYCLSAADGTQVWNYTTGSLVDPSPAVAGGFVYVGSEDHNVYCLNAATGTQVWNYTTGDDVASSSAVVGGLVYVGSDDGVVYCLNATTGAPVWSYETGSWVASSPAVVDGVAYVGSFDGKIYAFGVGTDWWPMFHHDLTRTGYSTSTGPTTNNTNWICGIGIVGNGATNAVGSSPAVVDGLVYVGCDDGNVSCVNATNGSYVWSYWTARFGEFGENAVHSSPAVVGGLVYVGSDDGVVYCLNATTGAQVWNYKTGGAVSSSPVVLGGLVYVGSDDGNVYCLDAATGAYVWNYATGSGVDSSPAVLDGLVYVGSSDNNVYCLDAATGTRVWNYTTGGPVSSSPAVVGSLIYVGSDDGYVYCLHNIRTVYPGRVLDTVSLVWRFFTVGEPGENVVYSSPAVVGGLVYVGSDDGLVYCLNATTGAQVWNYATGGAVSSSPAIVGSLVYVGSGDNRTYCLDAGTGALIWSRKTGGWVSSSPAVVTGEVYVGSGDGNVYAFGPRIMPVIVHRVLVPISLYLPLGVSIFQIQWTQNGQNYGLTFDATGGTGTEGTIALVVPVAAIPAGFTPTVSVDGAPAQAQQWTGDDQNYYISFMMHFSTHTVTIIFSPPLTVSIWPTSVTMDVGQSNLFNSTVSGGMSPYTYQWYLNGATVPSATSSSWTFTPSSSGSYDVYVNVTDNVDVDSIAKSNIASVTANPVLSVSISPTSVTLNVSQSQLFNSTISGGTSPYTYQWYLNATPVSGAIGSSWTFTPPSTGSYTVYVNVTDGAGAQTTSNTAASTIVPEFPSYLVLPLFMATTLLAAVLLKRKRNINT